MSGRRNALGGSFTRMRLLGAAIALAWGLLILAGPAAAEDTVWLCHPSSEPNPCAESLETTVEEPGGSTRVESPPLASDPQIDCFFVYPTVSNQPTPNANRNVDPELVAIARYQAGRFAQECRMFAPVYRQGTVLSILAGPLTGGSDPDLAYADVLAAWREYLERDNDGRGVVLIGHSQGTFMLRRLVSDEIDPLPAERDRLVSALLIGGNVLVGRGSDTGGDFDHVPACREPDQFGCVVGYSAFGEEPPDDPRFGRPRGGTIPADRDVEVLCNNPAALGGGRAELETYLRTEPFPGLIGLVLLHTYGGPPPRAPTPWLRPRDRYTGECVTSNGANVLMVEPIADARRLNASPDDSWGIHITDVNLALGDLVRLVSRQAAAHARRNTTVARISRRPLRPDRRARIRVVVGCQGPAACRGTLSVRSRGRRPVTLARSRYRIEGGARATVRLPPTSVGRRLARGGGVRSAVVQATYVPEPGERARTRRGVRVR